MSRMLSGLLRTMVVLVAFAASTLVVPQAPAMAVPADPQSTPTTGAVLDWLTRLPNRAGNRVLSGYFGGYSGNTFSLDQTTSLHDLTGQYPGLIACDYASWGQPPIDHTCNETLKNWWRDGGLVTVGVHMPRPDRLPGAFNQRLTEFGQLTDPQSALGAQWRADLDAVADGLLDLQAAGVPVLFRPLHEMNSESFWWSNQRPSEFVQVWRDMFTYLTGKGLHNLLWVYGPAAWSGNRTAYFPGAGYADIVGLSAYSDNPIGVTGYEELLTLGKPFAFTEIGPKTTPEGADPGDFDYLRWSQAIRDRFPATSYFLAWNDRWSPLRNQHANEFLNDRWFVNRGEISLSARTVAAGTPLGRGPATLLAGFETGSRDGWTGYQVKAGPWAVTEWASHGNGSLKADIDLGSPESYLTHGPIDLSNYRELSVYVRHAEWGNQAAGTTAKLFVRTPTVGWRDSGSATVDANGVRLTLDLAGIPDLASTTEVGVRFAPAAGASGQSAVYLDNLTGTGDPRLWWGFESGTVEGWRGANVTNGPWAVTEWASQGVRSLKADVSLAGGESLLYTDARTNLTGFTLLSVRVRTAPWGNQADGSTAKLYVKTGSGYLWRDSGSTLTGPDGTTLTLNLAGLPDIGDVREIGVYVKPAATATGGSSIYLDDLSAS